MQNYHQDILTNKTKILSGGKIGSATFLSPSSARVVLRRLSLGHLTVGRHTRAPSFKAQWQHARDLYFLTQSRMMH